MSPMKKEKSMSQPSHDSYLAWLNSEMDSAGYFEGPYGNGYLDAIVVARANYLALSAPPF